MKNVKNKILCFLKKHKIFTGMIIVAILYTATLPFVAINLPNNREIHSVGSIAFDKWQMNRVNRIEIETPIRTTVIEDKELINDIVNATMVAKSAGFNRSPESIIRLFRNDILIREMDFSSLHNSVRVYYPSPKHWFFFTSNLLCWCCGGGLVQLSDELVEKIQLHLFEYGNSLIPLK